MTRLFVDADACPVKEEVLKVAFRHELEVFFVSNRGMRPHPNPKIQHIMVAAGADKADDWIAEHIQPGDIAVTGDIPLASRVLAAGGMALSGYGKPFTKDSIGTALAMRELHQYLRESGEITSQHKSFSGSHRSRFLQELELMVQKSKSHKT